jgi:hypothetical protein
VPVIVKAKRALELVTRDQPMFHSTSILRHTDRAFARPEKTTLSCILAE